MSPISENFIKKGGKRVQEGGTRPRPSKNKTDKKQKNRKQMTTRT